MHIFNSILATKTMLDTKIGMFDRKIGNQVCSQIVLYIIKKTIYCGALVTWYHFSPLTL